MANLRTMAVQVASVSTVSLDCRMVRCVPDIVLNSATPPNYLFASGKPNRFNTAGVRCVYFGEDEKTARAEYAYHLGMDAYQPLGTFWAEVTLNRVVDLSDATVLAHLGLTVADVYGTWIGATSPTATQLLGAIVAGTRGKNRISAIRFPSAAMRHVRKKGFSVVIFADCVLPPDRVCIPGPGGTPLQEWP